MLPRALLLATLASAKKPLMPKCENQADALGASICGAMLKVGFYTCEVDFCPGCTHSEDGTHNPHAGVCNLSCDYCPTYAPTTQPSSYVPTTEFAPSYVPTGRPTRRPTAMDVTDPTRAPSYAPSRRPTSDEPSPRPTGAFPTRAPTGCENAADKALGDYTCAQWLAADGVDCSSVEGACDLACDACGPTRAPTMKYDKNSHLRPTFAADLYLPWVTPPPSPVPFVAAAYNASSVMIVAVVAAVLVGLLVAWRRRCKRDRPGGYAQFGEVREERAYEMPDSGLELPEFRRMT